jgi:glycosyltransferase involved in cell wall biosynthesis
MVLAPSEEDAATARRIAPAARVEVYPNSLPWIETPNLNELPRIVFSGNFEYHPNIDAVRFLLCEIWPTLRRSHPELRLRLVGRGDRFVRHLLPPGGVEETGIETTGPIPDAWGEIAAARIVIAPLRAGSGTRIKILEAWAAARCVVATPLAAEGLRAENGTNIALAATATKFIDELIRLLADSVARERMATHGRCTFEHFYTWEIARKSLANHLQLER